jgi:hypothetical protein
MIVAIGFRRQLSTIWSRRARTPEEIVAPEPASAFAGVVEAGWLNKAERM